MNLPNLKEMASGMLWLSSISSNLLTRSKNNIPVKLECDWEEEKTDILERANWLCEKVIVTPEQLLKAMPTALGTYYGPQWAIYSCSHLAAALANISYLYPEEKDLCLKRMEKIVDIVLTPQIRQYDTTPWKEDALETLAGDKSHMTYLSILAWIISNFKLAGGHNGYDELLHGCCEALNRRMLKSKDLCLLSFPNVPIFIPDMMFTIVALKNYAELYDGMYQESVDKWIEKAKNEWIHRGSGLLIAKLRTRWKNSRLVAGSHVALTTYCLTQVDELFAREQYERMKSTLRKDCDVFGARLCGIKEFLRKSPKLSFDVNAGPIVEGLSASGTAWAIGSATYFKDWEFRSQMLRTAEIAGNTIQDKDKRHYRLGELAIVGEAVVLAMKTHARR